MPHGTLVDAVLSRERGVNSLASAKGTGAAVTIYLRMDSLAGGSLLVPVTRPVASTLDLARAALEQLVGGPGQEFGLNPVLPTTTRIEGLSVQGGVATVDFSSDLAQAEDLDVAVAAIVLTLTELSGIDSVKLTIGGEAVKLHDGRVLSEPVLRPTSTNPLSF
jgi:spore germination protein GerM